MVIITTSFEWGVVPLPFVRLTSTKQRSGAGFAPWTLLLLFPRLLIPLLLLKSQPMLLQRKAGNEAGEGLGPFAVTIRLPPMRVVFAYDVEDVATLEGDAELVTRDVEVVVRGV